MLKGKIPDLNLNLQERMKITTNGKPTGTQKKLFFFSSLKAWSVKCKSNKNVFIV